MLPLTRAGDECSAVARMPEYLADVVVAPGDCLETWSSESMRR
jgi:hypothetical protein